MIAGRRSRGARGQGSRAPVPRLIPLPESGREAGFPRWLLALPAALALCTLVAAILVLPRVTLGTTVSGTGSLERVDRDSFRVLLLLPSSSLARIRPGDPVRVNVPDPGGATAAPLDGTVARVDRRAVEAEGAREPVPVLVTLAAPDATAPVAGLRDGAPVTGRVVAERSRASQVLAEWALRKLEAIRRWRP